MIRLVLVDDQMVVRQGLRRRLALEPDMTVIGDASNGREAIALVQQLAPDIVLMDVEMPEMDGISAAAVIHASTPRSAIVMLSIYDDVSTRARAKAVGAASFVNKGGSIEVLVASIRQVAEQKKAQTGSPCSLKMRGAHLGTPNDGEERNPCCWKRVHTIPPNP